MPGRYTLQPFFSGKNGPLDSVDTALAAGGGGPFNPSQDLGKIYNAPDGKRWQRVVYSSVLTAAAALKTIVYWKDASTMTVDTDLTDSKAGRNSVAGAIITGMTLPVASQYAWLLQEAIGVTVTSIQVNCTANAKVVASTTQGKVTVTAEGTAAVDIPIGTVNTAVDHSVDVGGGDVVIDLNVPSLLY